jgi:hypothetical protein
MIPEIKRSLIEAFTLDGDSIEVVGVLFDLIVEEVDDSRSLVEYHVKCTSREEHPRVWLFKFSISQERLATEHKDNWGRIERARQMIAARLHDWLYNGKEPGDEIHFDLRLAEIAALSF